MHALPPDLQRLVDLGLIAACDEDSAFLDALARAEEDGELTREQALTLGAMLGRSRALELCERLGDAA